MSLIYMLTKYLHVYYYNYNYGKISWSQSVRYLAVPLYIEVVWENQAYVYNIHPCVSIAV